ncbi:MAG: hypothetical protein ABIZ57_10215 [Candidatus Limnocylindria bacterium]
MSVTSEGRPLKSFLWSQAAAIAFSYAHTLMDWVVGLFGTDRATLSLASASLLGLNAAVYAGWAVALALAVRGDRAAMAAVLVFTFGWAFLVNGGSILFCLPPCPALAPYGDIAHLGSLVFGGWASVVAWRQIRAGNARISRRPAALAILLLVVTNVLSSVLAAEFLASQR